MAKKVKKNLKKSNRSKNTKNSPSKKSRDKIPLVLNIIFHLYFAATIIWLAFSILAVAGLMPIKDAFFSFLGLNFFIGNEVALVIMCAIYLIVAIGLLQLRKWARTLAIAFAIVESLISVYILAVSTTSAATIFSIFSLVAHGFIVIYFLFSKSVLKIFKVA
jgi:hypothetical protein